MPGSSNGEMLDEARRRQLRDWIACARHSRSTRNTQTLRRARPARHPARHTRGLSRSLANAIAERLGDAGVGTNNDRALLRELVDNGWSGHATPDSAAYRLVRVFRELVSARVIAFVLSECYEADPTFNYMTVRRREAPIWQLVTMQPQHLLDPQVSDLVGAAARLRGRHDQAIDGGTGRQPARPRVVRIQRRRLSASVVRCHSAVRPLARHARTLSFRAISTRHECIGVPLAHPSA